MELKGLHKDNGSTSYLLYVIWGLANATVFISHASLPGIPLRKRLLEIVWYFFWVFGEYSIAVLEYCCQDIESERKRCAFYDCQVHSLFSPKTQTNNQRCKKTYCSNRAMQNTFSPSQRRRILRQIEVSTLVDWLESKNKSEILINSILLLVKALIKQWIFAFDFERIWPETSEP